jgi:hypothetical protein
LASGPFDFVPIAFVDADHASGVAGDPAVGEEVGRVGEDEVEGDAGLEEGVGTRPHAPRTGHPRNEEIWERWGV